MNSSDLQIWILFSFTNQPDHGLLVHPELIAAGQPKIYGQILILFRAPFHKAIKLIGRFHRINRFFSAIIQNLQNVLLFLQNPGYQQALR